MSIVKTTAIVFTIACAVGPVATEVVRGLVLTNRLRRDAVTGTQNIAFWGSVATFGCGVIAAGCWGLWLTLR
jgi:hypothetical protein